MRRIKTGYYDRTGKNICDGDKVKAIVSQQIVRGYIDERGDEWFLVYQDGGLINLKFLDDIEILERD